MIEVDKRRRVLHVIDHLGLGGAQSAVLDLIANGDRSRWECEVAAMHGRGSFAEALERAGVRVHSLAASRWSGAYVPNFLRLVSARHFDVMHFHLQGANWIAKPLAALACEALRIAHDHASGDPRFRGWASFLPDAVAHLCSHRVIAVSETVKDFLVKWEALDPEVVEVVGNGIDTRVFVPPDSRARTAARKELGVDEGTFVVGALGRLAPEKDFTLLADVAAGLPGGLIVLGGEGPCRSEIEQAAAGAQGRLRMVGHVEDRPGFYRGLDAFVVCSKFEGLPMVLLEAMASGLPIVASRLPDLSEALMAGGCGFLAEPGQASTFVDALQELQRTSALRDQLGQAARRRCEETFSALRCARRVEAVYEECFGFAHERVAPWESA